MERTRIQAPYSLYRCEICKHYTNNEESIGKENFIVCNDCFNSVVKKCGKPTAENMLKILGVFFAIDEVRKEKQDH